jgi:hypothetical protein
VTTSLRELIALQRRCHGPRRLVESAGDGFLYLENPFFRRVRDAAWSAGFRYTLSDAGGYYGFPLIHLHTILSRREIPYRPSFSALQHLEARRPGFFTLADLQKNRPARIAPRRTTCCTSRRMRSLSTRCSGAVETRPPPSPSRARSPVSCWANRSR